MSEQRRSVENGEAVTLNEQALERARTAVGYGVYVCSPYPPEDDDVARAAVTAYLEAEAEAGRRLMPREPTQAMIGALSDPETPYVMRRNKLYDDGRQYEVIRMDNDDWRDVIDDDQTVMGRFPNEKEASALLDRLIAEFQYAALFDAAAAEEEKP